MVDAPPELTEEQQKELEKKLKSLSPEELRQLQKQQCIFCQIISGKIPSKKIYEDPSCLAILDINPATKGHLLLLPKEHYAIMPQVPQKELGHLFSVSKVLSRLQLRALHVSGTNIFIANGVAAGQRAQHFLLHLLPRKEGDGLLPVKDTLIDASLPEKVKAAVQDRLAQLIGTKKVVASKKNEERSMESSENEMQTNVAKAKKRRSGAPARKKKVGKISLEENAEREDGGAAADPAAVLDEIAELFK
ncbi:HIT family protein [Candidatus Woesearchaeota archaeon]|nr:HIT family protein [Candidatus Woesearchaeota archaeon]